MPQRAPRRSAATLASVGSATIHLYSYALSPYAAKVHAFLVWKGLPFTTVYVDPLRARRELPVGHTVPVLEIDGVARNDSTPIGLWLEERFPERPALLPRSASDREAVLGIDAWVTARLIPAAFRLMLAAGEPWRTRVRNRRRGARALQATAPRGLPGALRWLYPLVVARPAFIRHQLQAADPGVPMQAYLDAVYSELDRKLAAGSYLDGRAEPGLADLSAWAQLALPYLAGYDDADRFLSHAPLARWFSKLAERLPEDPPLLPPSLCLRPLAGADPS